MMQVTEVYMDGLTQDCSISIANALELLQSSIKPSICASGFTDLRLKTSLPLA